MIVVYKLITFRIKNFIGDSSIVTLFLVFFSYILLGLISYQVYVVKSVFFYLFFADSVFYHINRKDIKLLRFSNKHKLYLFCEYLLYSTPFLLILLFEKKITHILAILLAYFTLIYIPRIEIKYLKYPFNLITPHWVTLFRRYKIIFVLVIFMFLCVMGYLHNNYNIFIFVLISISFICCLPSFERERVIEIKYSELNSEEYLNKQIASGLKNILCVISPFFLFISIITLDVNFVLYSIISILIPSVNILLKYYFFKSILNQQLYMIFAIIFFGIPFLLVPLMYKKTILNINKIKNA